MLLTIRNILQIMNVDDTLFILHCCYISILSNETWGSSVMFTEACYGLRSYTFSSMLEVDKLVSHHIEIQ